MGRGGEPLGIARLLCEPRSRGASRRVPDLAPRAEVGWFFCLREAEQSPPACVARCVGGWWWWCGLCVPRSARSLLGRFPFPREKGTETGT